MKGPRASEGFALIASLLFLIVLTILGVSSMSTVGLQERMAANLKEKERATEAAEVAARGAEVYLADYPPPGVFEEIPESESMRASGEPTPNVWILNGPIPDTVQADAAAQEFATNDAMWSDSFTFEGPPFDDETLIGTGVNVNVDEETGVSVRVSEKYAAKPRSYTEEFVFQPYSLDPEDLATGAGVFYYRVTGRGVGGNDTAVSVVQSMYSQRFK